MNFDSISTVLRRALILGGAAGVAVGVITGAIGLAVAGSGGLWSGLVGAGLTIVFLGLTALGVLATGRLAHGDTTVAFGVLMVAWFAKFVVFLAVILVVGRQAWVVPGVLLASIVGTVLVSLLVDCVVVARARIPVTNRV